MQTVTFEFFNPSEGNPSDFIGNVTARETAKSQEVHASANKRANVTGKWMITRNREPRWTGL